jgi:hypothetical protein
VRIGWCFELGTGAAGTRAGERGEQERKQDKKGWVRFHHSRCSDWLFDPSIGFERCLIAVSANLASTLSSPDLHHLRLFPSSLFPIFPPSALWRDRRDS